MILSLRTLIDRECRSRHEGEPPPHADQESWVPQFLALFLGEDGEGLDGVAVALCEEGRIGNGV